MQYILSDNSQVPYKVNINGGVVNISYIPPVPGKYTIDIVLEHEPMPGFPKTFMVGLPSTTAIQNVKVSKLNFIINSTIICIINFLTNTITNCIINFAIINFTTNCIINFIIINFTTNCIINFTIYFTVNLICITNPFSYLDLG